MYNLKQYLNILYKGTNMEKMIKLTGNFPDGKKEIIVGAEEIQKILFHRGLKLLLNRVVIKDSDITGEFQVSQEICYGHEPFPYKPVHRGVELVEMGFQLLGVSLAKSQEMSPLLQGKVISAREIIFAKFNGFIFPGDTIFLNMKTDVSVKEVAELIVVESGRMVAKVDNKMKATVAVSLVAFDSRKLIDELRVC
jgi:3-hydroxymyristoyl/3-hydroxydecanoyl-(acyl carrier protein) dehydratase